MKRLFFFSALIVACGKGSTQSASHSDAYPTGAVIRAQGTLIGVSTTTITGSALVLETTEGTITLRLASLNGASAFSTSKVSLLSNGVSVYQSGLKAASGNQNYLTGLTNSQTWSSVEILDTTKAPPNDVMARALLTSPTTTQ